MNTIEKNGFCPLVGKPEAECYCMNITSLTIRQLLYYCKSNYERCDIYLNKELNHLKGVGEVV